jgi:hypothetical protein
LGQPVAQHSAPHTGAYDDDIPRDAFCIACVKRAVSQNELLSVMA